jgi:hypothetical protein
VLEKQGDKAKAIELLKKLHERLAKPGESHYVRVPRASRGRPASRARSDGDPAQVRGSVCRGPGQKQFSASADSSKLMEQMKHGQPARQGAPATPGGPAGGAAADAARGSTAVSREVRTEHLACLRDQRSPSSR